MAGNLPDDDAVPTEVLKPDHRRERALALLEAMGEVLAETDRLGLSAVGVSPEPWT